MRALLYVLIAPLFVIVALAEAAVALVELVILGFSRNSRSPGRSGGIYRTSNRA